MKKIELNFPKRKIETFCLRWKITELAIFGSALRQDFTAQSDVDVLVTFQPSVEWSLIDQIQMEEELSQILDRSVDLISKRAVERSENWIRRETILNSAEVVYAT